MSINFDKFIKVMGMTGSSHDAEALSALRMAQKMLKDEKMTWADVFSPRAGASQQRQQEKPREERKAYQEPPRSKPREEPPRSKGHEDEDVRAELRKMAAKAYKAHPELFTDWERSFMDDWDERHDYWPMSEKQFNVFIRIVNKYNHYMNMRKRA